MPTTSSSKSKATKPRYGWAPDLPYNYLANRNLADYLWTIRRGEGI